MRTLSKNQRAIDGAKYEGDGAARERIRITDTDGLILELSPTGNRSWRCYASDQTGKKVWITIGSARSIGVGSASDAAKTFVEATKLGTPKSSETFDSLVRDWIEKHGKVHKRSWESDEDLYERHIATRLGDTPLADIDVQVVIATTDAIREASTPSQARASHALISAALTWGVRSGRCNGNPAKGAPRAAAAEHRDRLFSDDELRRIWHGSDKLGTKQQATVKLLLLLGARRSEIIEMERAELDLGRGLFTLRAQRRKAWRIGRKPVPHVVPLPPLALRLISEAVQDAGRSKFVFPHRTQGIDEPMSPDNVTTAFAGLLRSLKIEDGRLHDLRRAAKTLMVRNKVPRVTADACQDHKGLGNAGDIYDAHDYLDEKRAALTTLEAAVTRIVGKPA